MLYPSDTRLEDEPTKDDVRKAYAERHDARQFVKARREQTFVNSWHAQDHESAAMWALYVKSGEGIAVESTYARFVKSLVEFQEHDVHIGMINYIDYQIESIPRENLLSPYIHKRKSFEYEKELRALISVPRSDCEGAVDSQAGIYVPIKLDVLINRIFVAPTAPDWTIELIRSVIKKYDLKIEVLQSSLSSKPLY